jgi:hypothetical protein
MSTSNVQTNRDLRLQKQSVIPQPWNGENVDHVFIFHYRGKFRDG